MVHLHETFVIHENPVQKNIWILRTASLCDSVLGVTDTGTIFLFGFYVMFFSPHFVHT